MTVTVTVPVNYCHPPLSQKVQMHGDNSRNHYHCSFLKNILNYRFLDEKLKNGHLLMIFNTS